MANNPIDMKKLRALLRLYFKGYSKRSIARSCGTSRTTVNKYIQVLNELQMSLSELENLSNIDLQSLFIQIEDHSKSSRILDAESFFPYMEKELRKTGVTRLLLWEEYKEKFPEGYQRSQFCEHYRRWSKRVHPSMHIEYKAGDKLLVDYAGKKLDVVDRLSGEVIQVEIFVSILGATQMIYIEASESQKKADFIKSCENALQFYGGVPKAIVTDNLKSAVTKSNRYEPKLNPDFEDFAEHYQMSVIPTRAYKPKDKALVEGAVRICYQQIYARIRNEIFHSTNELNKALWHHLDKLNDKILSGRPYSRKTFFLDVELKTLSPLAEKRFEIRNYAQATVLQNGHVSLKEDKHYYSVPYQYIRKKVKIAYTSIDVKIYYNYLCIAEHQRVKSPYNYTTVADHLASKHKQYTKWNADYFLKWASSIDPKVSTVITNILEKKQHPEQAYRSCIGVLSLNKKVGRDRFLKACSLAISFEQYSYISLVSILDKGLDRLQDSQEEIALPKHKNIRGKSYYETIKPSNNE